MARIVANLRDDGEERRLADLKVVLDRGTDHATSEGLPIVIGGFHALPGEVRSERSERTFEARKGFHRPNELWRATYAPQDDVAAG
jgi:hypothetical protein